MKKNNRFIEFFNKKAGSLSFFKYLLILVSFSLFGIIILEVALYYKPLRERVSLDYYFWGTEDLGFRHHPYLDYVHDYNLTESCPNNNSNDEYLKINIYGGSTIDSGGIPQNLAKFLCEEGVNVKVNNFGQLGYVNTQEMIKLILQVREGGRPDIVVFYDGLNDLEASAGRPRTNATKEVFNFYFFHKDNPLSHSIDAINLFLRRKGFIEGDPVSNAALIDFFEYDLNEETFEAEKIMEIYLENVKIVDNLKEIYGFEPFFYWQPNLTNKKNLSEEEKMHKEYDYDDFQKYAKAQDAVDLKLRNNEKVSNLKDVFGDYEGQVFTDMGHKTIEGHEIVGRRIADDILNYLENNSEKFPHLDF